MSGQIIVDTSNGPICVQCLDNFGRRHSNTVYSSELFTLEGVIDGALVIPDPEITIPAGLRGFFFECRSGGSFYYHSLNLLSNCKYGYAYFVRINPSLD